MQLHFLKVAKVTIKTIWGAIEGWDTYLAKEVVDNSRSSKPQSKLAEKITLANS